MSERIVALVFLLGLVGCVGSDGAKNRSANLTFNEGFDTAIMTGGDLMFPILFYRMDTGRWPQSPEDMRENEDYAIDCDRFENLTFELRDDGDLEIAFDRWVGSRGFPGISRGRYVIHAVEE